MNTKKQVMAEALKKATDNSKINKDKIKEYFKKEIWVDMFEDEVNSEWCEEASEEYVCGYLDGNEDDVSFDTSFDWKNVTEESVLNWCYNKGLEDRYDDICDYMESTSDGYDYELCERAERDYYI